MTTRWLTLTGQATAWDQWAKANFNKLIKGEVIAMLNKFETELNAGNQVVILSGEGEQGTFELYTGERTDKAIKQQLEQERCNGDRWASAWIYLHTNDGGDVYADMEDGELRHIDSSDID